MVGPIWRGFLIFSICLVSERAVADQSEVDRLIELAKNAPGQQRATIVVNRKLTRAAQAKADDLLARDYFAHTNPNGVGPNYLVRSFGYRLPAYYGSEKDSNNIESLSMEYGYGPVEAERVWNGWLGSPGHRRHVLGETDFYAEQTHVGVAVATDGSRSYWVFLSAPPSSEGSPGPSDSSGPEITFQKPRSTARPAMRMAHQGLVSDEIGVEEAALKVVGMPWQNLRIEHASGRWRASTRLKGRARTLLKRKGMVTIRVKATDRAGKTSIGTRRYKR